ncbi:sigma-70 family RNA polymerase sigma factor [Salinactinospora qingdaonensis]|uniref:RNA polymerase sigma factor, sigma-70 family n=1 Tax=Salinactinospora qingdaonensis TaxID=702744 RepID=A0ABP7FL39_9ACTN
MTDAQSDHFEKSESDEKLISAVRDGDSGAYAALYRRHAEAARGLARQLVRSAEVDDVVSEAFARVLSVLRRGSGPTVAFRPYLLTSLRHIVYDRYRTDSRQIATDDMATFDEGEPFVDPALAGLERSLIARAYLSLPEHWRSVLWHTEIEGAKPADVAPLLNLTPNSVSALAYRAREGLRRAYLQMHLAGEVPTEECRPALSQLGAYVRGGLAKRDAATVDRHLDSCAHCRAVYAELSDVNIGLRGVVGPLIAGPAMAGYLASLPGGAFAGGWWSQMSTTQQRATMAGAATTAVTAAVALAMVSQNAPPPAPERPAAVAPPTPSDTDPPPQAPTPPPPGTEAPSLAPSRSVGPEPAPSPPSPPPSPAAPEPPRPTPSAVPTPPRPSASPEAEPALAATINPVGALVPGHPGIVVMRLRNTGGTTSDDVVADLDLPEGVTLDAAAQAGSAAAVPMAAGADGWSCVPETSGARCVVPGIEAGEDAVAHLDVAVASDARAGEPPRVSVRVGGVTTAATGSHGVDPEGTPARYATSGQVRSIATGNTLMTCLDDFSYQPQPRWPWPFDTTGSVNVQGFLDGDRRPRPDTLADERPAPAPVVSSFPKPTVAPTQPSPSAATATRVSVPTPSLASTPSFPATPEPAPASSTPAAPAPSTVAPQQLAEPEPPTVAPLGDGACERARRREGDRLDNDLWSMRPLDLDRDPATHMSSSVRWQLPTGGAVRWAGLYFSGTGRAPGGVTAKLRGPGQEGYTTVDADETAVRHLPGSPAYQAFADVTEQVRRAGGGQWWLADIPTSPGAHVHAGWSLVVVVSDPAEDYNQTMVLDNATVVHGAGAGMRLPLAGLLSAQAQAGIDVVAWEGDAGLSGDRVLLGDTPLRRRDGDPDNAFIGSAAGAVGPPLTFGTDVAQFSTVLPRHPRLLLVSRRDAYFAGAVAVTSPIMS